MAFSAAGAPHPGLSLCAVHLRVTGSENRTFTTFQALGHPTRGQMCLLMRGSVCGLRETPPSVALSTAIWGASGRLPAAQVPASFDWNLLGFIEARV